MIKYENKNEQRKHRQMRIRAKVSGTAACPRLNVYKSTNHIYAQIIDDVKGVTLVSASTAERAIANSIAGKTKSEKAYAVGQEIGRRAKKKSIKGVVFDRSGYIYTGRVKSLAEGARSEGLEF